MTLLPLLDEVQGDTVLFVEHGGIVEQGVVARTGQDYPVLRVIRRRVVRYLVPVRTGREVDPAVPVVTRVVQRDVVEREPFR